MTPAERKAKERAQKRAAGLVPVHAWVPKDREAQVLAAIEAATSGVDRETIEPVSVPGKVGA